jgi:cytochrome b subunit of formate dehydrogenase
MLAATTPIFWTIVTFAFVFVVVGLVLYALVRPFTDPSHTHRPGLWVHLP